MGIKYDETPVRINNLLKQVFIRDPRFHFILIYTTF